MVGESPELGLGGRQSVALQDGGLPSLVESQQQELAESRHQHLPIALQVAEHLGRRGDGAGIGNGRFDLDGPAGRLLPAQAAFAHLVGREEAPVR